MTDIKLNINDKFRDLLDLPSESEQKELERQLVRDGGPRDPIVVWDEKDTIVDGHNRYSVCKAHNLPFTVNRRSFKDEAEVETWILENQLARRNLSPARTTYFLGKLYNTMKQDPSKAREATGDNKATAEKLGEQFGVDEKTVRRAGDVAKGLETVANIKGLQSVKEKLELLKAKNAEGFTKGELEEIGKVKDPVVAQEAAKIMVTEKKKAATTVAATKKPAKPEKPKDAPKKAEAFGVVFSKPAFDKTGWSVSTEERPNMADNCMVYIAVPDEELVKGIDLIRKWGLTYEASFIFKCDRYEGTWSDITHMNLLAASRGIMTAPKKAVQSINGTNGPVDAAMIKLIESYHPGVKRLDMRRNVTAEGWNKAA